MTDLLPHNCADLHPTIAGVVRFDSPQRVRSEGRRRRRAVEGDDRVAREQQLCERLAADPVVTAASIVGVYLADDGEPDLSHAVAAIRARTTQLALPVLEDDPDSFAMRFARWPDGARLVDGRYGIAVPDPLVTCEPDVIVVPLVGFDADGNRVGRGAGFYDRYLAESAATTVGVAFDCQRFDALPVQPHDVGLHAVITECETLRSGSVRPKDK